MEEKILKFFYDKFPDPYIVSFTGIRVQDFCLNPNKDKLESERTLDQLKYKHYLKISKGNITITFKGVHYYEESYLKKVLIYKSYIYNFTTP